MLLNYLKIAFRNLVKQKAYSAINIFGLAIGIASCILAGLYIFQEFGFDTYHERSGDIYRVARNIHIMSREEFSVETPALTAPTISGQFPEIEQVSRIFFSDDDLVKHNDVMFYEDEVIYADSTFFKIFSFETLQGNSEKFLRGKNGIVITREMAGKYFGKKNPIGKILELNNKHEFEVQGVIENIPVNSHFTFDFAINYRALDDTPVANYLEQWGATFGSYTYVLCSPGMAVEKLEEKISDHLNGIIPFPNDASLSVFLQPLEDIHLYSAFEDEIQPNNSISNIVVLILIVFFILLLAAINFINLTTARAVKRAREIGVRKVLGAFKSQLIKQFLGESVLVSVLSLLTGLVLVELFKPSFSELVGMDISSEYLTQFGILSVILIGTLCVGLLAGLYPAFVLTYFQPVKVLKGGGISSDSSTGTGLLRKGLVIVQFSVSIILIVTTLLMNRQVDYMRNFEMGFEDEQVIVLETPERMRDKYETIKNELNEIPGVVKSSACLGVPIYDSGFGTNLEPNTENSGEPISIAVKMIDDDYNDLFGLELVAGRELAELSGADYTKVTVINETLMKELGYNNPDEVLGQVYRIGLNGFVVEVVGVIKDFHFNNLHEEVRPLIFMKWSGLFHELAVKVSPGGIPSTLERIENVWNIFYAEYPFTYGFLDEKIDALYKADERSFNVITTFSVLAIFIACLGLLGLTFYTTEQRRKEIGVRKVLGATVVSIINKIASEFLTLVMIANLIAWPVSYYIVTKWLAEFPYKTSVGIDLFLLAGFATVSIAFVTISYTIIKSAFTNPVESLRYE